MLLSLSFIPNMLCNIIHASQGALPPLHSRLHAYRTPLSSDTEGDGDSRVETARTSSIRKNQQSLSSLLQLFHSLLSFAMSFFMLTRVRVCARVHAWGLFLAHGAI